MRERGVGWLVVLVLAALSLSACGPLHSMRPHEMGIAINPSELPKKSTMIGAYMDPDMWASEGGDGRVSWPMYMVDRKTGEEIFFPATSTEIIDPDTCRVTMIAVIPVPIDQVTNNTVFWTNRSGTKVYNQRGESRRIKSISSKLDLEKYGKFLPKIEKGQSFVVEIEKGAPGFKRLDYLLAYRVLEDRVKYVKWHINMKTGRTTHTDEQLDELYRNDQTVKKFADWAGKGWKIFLTYPFFGIDKAVLIAGVVKVMELPSAFGDPINLPGYSQYLAEAEEVSKIADRRARITFCEIELNRRHLKNNQKKR